MVDQQQSGASLSAASLVPLPLVLVLLSMREPPFIPHSGLSLTQQTHFISAQAALLLEVNELQRLTYPVCSAGDFSVERKDFGADLHKLNLKPLPPQNNVADAVYNYFEKIYVSELLNDILCKIHINLSFICP